MMTTPNLPDLIDTPRYTAAEAARMLGMHANTVRRWLDLPAARGVVVHRGTGY